MQIESRRRINITNTDDSSITGSKFLSDGRLMLCDTDDCEVKLFSRDFELEDSISYRDGFVTIWAVGIVNETTAVVTKPFKNQMEFIHYVPNLRRGRSVDIGTNCYGADVLEDTIYLVCHDGPIRRYDLNGNFKSIIPETHFREPYWISANQITETLCVADWVPRSDAKITCLKPNGDVTFMYTSSSLRGPQAVLSDDHDNLIIADWVTNNIQIVKKSDQTHRNLLTKEDGIDAPYSLAYRRSDKTLVIGQYWIRWFHIVKLM